MSTKYFLLASAVLVGGAWAGRSALDVSPMYTADLNGAQETPPNTEKGSGAATFNVDSTKRIKYSLRVNGLTGNPTAAHIHVGAAGVAGPPVYTFMLKSSAGENGTISNGDIDLSQPASAGVSGDSLMALLRNGNAYVNVHTAKYPDGEVRGQIKSKM